MTPIQSICVLRLSAIGDVCNALAVVQAIQLYYPNAQITWVIGRLEAELFKSVPGIRFVIFDKKDGVNAYRKLRKTLPNTFDVLLHMQVALRANIAAACIRARRKIGFPKHLSKEFHRCVVNEYAPAAKRPHVLEGFASFAYAIGVPVFVPEWNIPLSNCDQQWLTQFLSQTALLNQQIVVISPSASNSERNWLPQHYSKLADYIAEKGFSVVLCGGSAANERQLGEQILSSCKTNPVSLIGQTTLTQLLSLINYACVVVSPDSGPAHMATTQQTPVLGLYAHSNPERTGPYHSMAWVVDVYHQQLAIKNITTSSIKWGARLKGDHLMAEIHVEKVTKMFDQLCRDRGLLNDN